MSIEVSLILPAYNVASKMEGCLRSLEDLRRSYTSFEAVFVDDVSTDSTFNRIQEWSRDRDWVSVLQLSQNSGSPSAPRNHGLDFAKGEYVYFLDPDDELNVQGFCAGLQLAKESNADLVRSPLLRFDGKDTRLVNEVAGWSSMLSRGDKIKTILSNQSTNPPGLIRRRTLIDHSVTWPTSLRMGEDTVFLIRALMASERIEYNNEPDFIYDVEVISGAVSSTQQYNDRELLNHVEVWTQASQALEPLGTDYFSIRGQVALQAVFQSLIKFNTDGISKISFGLLRDLLLDHRVTIEGFDYGPRLSELRDLVLDGQYENFINAIKARLVIAGYDLKFIKPAIPEIERYFQVRLDEWTGHDTHNVEQSLELLEWGEVIHCEWMLGNAVWYSKNKRRGQILIVRAHRFEQTRNFGFELDVANIDRIIAVSVHTMEDFLLKFQLPRDKFRLVPNFLEVDNYLSSENPDRVYNLAMIGSVPALKGFHRALDLLSDLRKIDKRYNLTVYGKSASELPWIQANSVEREYFEECQSRINTKGLTEAVFFAGWADTKVVLAEKGITLSLSDLESFHVAPAEGFAAGNVSFLLPWRGVEYIYPSEFICQNLIEMRGMILACRDISTFTRLSTKGREFVRDRYSLDRFIELYLGLIKSV